MRSGSTEELALLNNTTLRERQGRAKRSSVLLGEIAKHERQCDIVFQIRHSRHLTSLIEKEKSHLPAFYLRSESLRKDYTPAFFALSSWSFVLCIPFYYPVIPNLDDIQYK